MLSIVQYNTFIKHAFNSVFFKDCAFIAHNLWLLFFHLNHNKNYRSIFSALLNDDCRAYLSNCLMMLQQHQQARILLQIF